MRALHDDGGEALLGEEFRAPCGVREPSAVNDAQDGSDELLVAETQDLAAQLGEPLLTHGQKQIFARPCDLAHDLARNVAQDAGAHPPRCHALPMVATAYLAPRLGVDVDDARLRLVHHLAPVLHPVLRPLDVFETGESLVERVLLPQVAPHGGVGVVGEGIVRITHFMRTCRK